MKISIACALYNGEVYIKDQLESLYNQTLQSDEVVLYDDQSTDHTYNIVHDYIRDHNITNWHAFQQKSNKGYIQNFHDALHACTGDIIFLCDQDDIWDSHKIQTCVDYFENNPNIQCLNTSYNIWNMDKNEKTENKQNFSKLDCTFQKILIRNISMGCTMAIKKPIVDLYINHTTCMAPHDWELNAIAASHSSLAYIQEPLITYRIHQANTTGIDNINKKKSIVEDSRKKNAHTIDTLARALTSYTFYDEDTLFLNRYRQFATLRYDLLHNKKIGNWFRLMKYHKIYTAMLSMKGILVDLLYACFSK